LGGEETSCPPSSGGVRRQRGGDVCFLSGGEGKTTPSRRGSKKKSLKRLRLCTSQKNKRREGRTNRLASRKEKSLSSYHGGEAERWLQLAKPYQKEKGAQGRHCVLNVLLGRRARIEKGQYLSSSIRGRAEKRKTHRSLSLLLWLEEKHRIPIKKESYRGEARLGALR